ncbi:hypothetical protein SNEBB_007212 [Seison nebaliae]|nr:hypothetical protein SNEBB_007212 [Seison nebaliae]
MTTQSESTECTLCLNKLWTRKVPKDWDSHSLSIINAHYSGSHLLYVLPDEIGEQLKICSLFTGHHERVLWKNKMKKVIDAKFFYTKEPIIVVLFVDMNDTLSLSVVAINTKNQMDKKLMCHGTFDDDTGNLDDFQFQVVPNEHRQLNAWINPKDWKRDTLNHDLLTIVLINNGTIFYLDLYKLIFNYASDPFHINFSDKNIEKEEFCRIKFKVDEKIRHFATCPDAISLIKENDNILYIHSIGVDNNVKMRKLKRIKFGGTTKLNMSTDLTSFIPLDDSYDIKCEESYWRVIVLGWKNNNVLKFYGRNGSMDLKECETLSFEDNVTDRKIIQDSASSHLMIYSKTLQKVILLKMKQKLSYLVSSYRYGDSFVETKYVMQLNVDLLNSVLLPRNCVNQLRETIVDKNAEKLKKFNQSGQSKEKNLPVLFCLAFAEIYFGKFTIDPMITASNLNDQMNRPGLMDDFFPMAPDGNMMAPLYQNEGVEEFARNLEDPFKIDEDLNQIGNIFPFEDYEDGTSEPDKETPSKEPIEENKKNKNIKVYMKWNDEMMNFQDNGNVNKELIMNENKQENTMKLFRSILVKELHPISNRLSNIEKRLDTNEKNMKTLTLEMDLMKNNEQKVMMKNKNQEINLKMLTNISNVLNKLENDFQLFKTCQLPNTQKKILDEMEKLKLSQDDDLVSSKIVEKMTNIINEKEIVESLSNEFIKIVSKEAQQTWSGEVQQSFEKHLPLILQQVSSVLNEGLNDYIHQLQKQFNEQEKQFLESRNNSLSIQDNLINELKRLSNVFHEISLSNEKKFENLFQKFPIMSTNNVDCGKKDEFPSKLLEMLQNVLVMYKDGKKEPLSASQPTLKHDRRNSESSTNSTLPYEWGNLGEWLEEDVDGRSDSTSITMSDRSAQARLSYGHELREALRAPKNGLLFKLLLQMGTRQYLRREAAFPKTFNYRYSFSLLLSLTLLLMKHFNHRITILPLLHSTMEICFYWFGMRIPVHHERRVFEIMEKTRANLEKILIMKEHPFDESERAILERLVDRLYDIGMRETFSGLGTSQPPIWTQGRE